MKYLVAAVFAAAATVSVSNATVIDFVAEAAASPGGIANGYTKNFGGFNVTITASRGNPYLDGLYLKRPGGLGACILVGGPGSGCDNSLGNNTDNVGKFDSVTLDFGRSVDLSGFSFTDAEHFDLNASSFTLLVNGVEWTFSNLVAATLSGVTALTLAWGGSNPSQFYLNEVAAVPIPAAAPLILSGLAGLGFAARRRRKAS
ncbi:MAG: VPLPA-CTERM sorting domain-containing protein [Parvularculaceae bacterium]|nr:VPLPA-CTERM sorting domain-containing protein [Parvularculaceae bacterium]